MNLPQMSAYGAVMVFVITAIRALAINRLPKKTFLALWGIALTRLLLPYSLPSVFSIYSLLGQLAMASEEARHLSYIQQDSIPVTTATAVPDTTAVLSTEPDTLNPWLIGWLVGMSVCGVFFMIVYLRGRGIFRISVPVDNEFIKSWLGSHRTRRPVSIRDSDRVSAPLTYGVFRPVILLPKNMACGSGDGLKFVLAHEYVHIRRFDAVTKLVLTAALCVHWFNPAVWLMYALANRDIELSCDEAVVRLFGEHAKSAYALTLIRMEEVRSGLAPLCNNFSRNAIEERIVAIMKGKKTSLAAMFTATALIIGVTTAFATSAQPDNDENTGTIEQEVLVGSYTDPEDGKTYYTWDGGKTWTHMTDEEFDAQLAASDVEWWTYEDYAAWLENEKKELQTVIGEYAWTSADGWFIWDQEKVDEAIAQYEATLQQIKDGLKISKTVDGSEDTVIAQGSGDIVSAVEIETGDAIIGEAKDLSAHDKQLAKHIADSRWFPDYEKYGLSFDKERSVLLYKGQEVSCFHDETSLNVFTHAVFNHGDVAVEVQRDADWRVKGLKERAIPLNGITTEVTQTTVGEASSDVSENVDQTLSQDELIAAYGNYGISFDKSGKMLYDNEYVRFFVDGVDVGSGGFATRYVYQNDDGKVDIHTVRDRIYNGDGSYDPFGPLEAIVPYEDGEIGFYTFQVQDSAGQEVTEAAGTSVDNDGVTFSQRFAKYKDFGITYVEAPNASGAGNVYYNGQLVSRFVDINPDGGAFSFSSAKQGGINVKTVYDSNEKLTGLITIKE